MNPTLETIYNRKSVRHFTSEPLSEVQVEVILRAAMSAPSAKNMQAWQFVVVTERKQLDALADALPFAKMLFKAQTAIVVCGNIDKIPEGLDKDYWIQDCSAATQNILLAATSLGLGCVWTAIYPYDERLKPARKILNIPPNIIPLNIIPVGHSDKEKERPSKDKWNPENIIYNKY